MRILAAVMVPLLMLPSCAAMMRPSATQSGNSSKGSGDSSANSSNSSNNSGNSSNDSSRNSGQSSNNSSANSGNSTGQSKNSSGSSNNTSYHSNNSSQGSRNSSNTNTSNATTDDPNVQNFSIALAGSALLVTTGVAVGLILYFALRTGQPAEPSKLRDEAEPAKAWLRANERQLRADLALGAGPALEDLAAAAEIRPANLGRFSAMLAEHREELLAPLEGDAEVSIEATVQVMSRIGALTLADPVLRADADAFVGRHRPEG